MQEKNQMTINISSLTIIKVIGIFLFLGFLYLIRDILIIVLISVIIAATLNPLVNFFQRKKFRELYLFLLFI